MHTAQPFSVLALAAVLTTCAPTDRAPAGDDAAVQQQIADRLAGLRAALLAGSVDSFLTFWTDDVRVLEPGVDRSGEAFRQYIREFLATGKVVSLDIQPYDRFVHGDVAYETGQYDETAQIPGQSPMVFKNYYFSRWERGEDGLWRIDRFVAGPRDAPAGM